MERRYDLLAEVGFRDITGYNAAVDRGDLPDAGDRRSGARSRRRDASRGCRSSSWSIDELADLMMVAARDVEESICRIAQMARAVGIHLVIATQRPSVNVITGAHQGQRARPASPSPCRRRHRQPGHPRPAGRRAAHRQGRHAPARRRLVGARRIQGSWVTEDEVRKVAARVEAPGARRSPTTSRCRAADDGRGGSSGLARRRRRRRRRRPAVRRRWSSWSAASSGPRRCCSASSGSASPGPAGSWTCSSSGAWSGPSEGSKARAVLMTVEELDELVDGAGLAPVRKPCPDDGGACQHRPVRRVRWHAMDLTADIPRTRRRAAVAAAEPPAARASSATKIYGSGDTAVVALDGVTRRDPRRPVHRHHGPVRLGQVDADALPGRARLAHLRPGLHRRHATSATLSDKGLTRCAATGSASCSSRSTWCRR